MHQINKSYRFLLIAIVMAVLFVGAVSQMVSASSITSPPPLPEGKVYIVHYGPDGVWDGFHLIDMEELWNIQKAILDKGGLPTSENVDHVFDCTKYPYDPGCRDLTRP